MFERELLVMSCTPSGTDPLDEDDLFEDWYAKSNRWMSIHHPFEKERCLGSWGEAFYPRKKLKGDLPMYYPA